eukprot:symbB.v1.2.026348.t1/scaffold2625.1/size74540/2
MKDTVFVDLSWIETVVTVASPNITLAAKLAPDYTFEAEAFGFRMRLLKVVGGSDVGILVRKDRALDSEMEEERLEHGAIVHEVQVTGGRLQYQKRDGEGPELGWVSLQAAGKRLLEELNIHDWPLHSRSDDFWHTTLSEETYAVMRSKLTEPRGTGTLLPVVGVEVSGGG